MGCYGIGIDRILAAAIEANHDDDGIIWPREIAPFDVHLVGLNLDRPGVREAAENVYASLRAAGIETLFDDRDEAAGVKFKDADLLGMPLRLTVSPRTVERGAAEARHRRSREQSDLLLADVATDVPALLG
jgi:prolyl-tRNA synthetase